MQIGSFEYFYSEVCSSPPKVTTLVILFKVFIII
jgi:hypothetical protein